MATSESDHRDSDPQGNHQQTVPLRKPANLTWESFADRRIREAEQAGAFAHLPGLGKPIPDIDLPLTENWWVKKKLQSEQLSVVPPTIAARRDIERTRESIVTMGREAEVRRLLEALNDRIREAIYSTTLGPADGVQLLDIEGELARWKVRRAEKPARP